MNAISFEVTGRDKTSMGTVIRAAAKEPEWNMTLYLDGNTGDVLYPVIIEPAIAIVSITLATETEASCALPPSVPDSMVNQIIRYLNTFHDAVAAARKLILEEQERLKDTRA